MTLDYSLSQIGDFMAKLILNKTNKWGVSSWVRLQPLFAPLELSMLDMSVCVLLHRNCPYCSLCQPIASDSI